MTIVHLLEVKKKGGLVGAIEHENEEVRKVLVAPEHAVVVYNERGNYGWIPENFSTRPDVIKSAMNYVSECQRNPLNPLVNNHRLLGSYDIPTTALGQFLDSLDTLQKVQGDFEMCSRGLMNRLSDYPMI
ncbi:MAG: hypothetical protein V1663_01735 [archaeon]